MGSPSRLTRAILFDLVGVLLFPNESYTTNEVVEALDEAAGQCCDDA